MASVLETKDWGPGEWRDVHAAVSRHLSAASAAGNLIAASASWQEGVESLATGAVSAVIHDGYLIVYTVGSMWCTPGPFLFEMLYIRIRPSTGNLRGVIRTLESLAAHHGCRGIFLGNGVRRKGLMRVYEREGYTPVTTQLYKEIP